MEASEPNCLENGKPNLRNLNLSKPSWETVFLQFLHAVRSLLCTTTIATSHERFLNFHRRSMLGSSLPNCWLQSGPVLLRRFVQTKSQPLVRRRRSKRYPLQVRHKQDWGRGFILLPPQTAALPGSDAGSDVIKPALSFVIQNRQTACSMWCPMYRARC